MSTDKARVEMETVKRLMEIADKLYASGHHAKCREMYQVLTTRYPNSIEACLNFSNLMRALGDPLNALKELERGRAICGDDYRLLCNQGKLLNDIGKQREARSVLLKGICEYEYDSHTWNNLGNSYYELGDLARALEAYERAVTLKPDCPDAESSRVKTMRRIEGMETSRNNPAQLKNVVLTGTCKACRRRFKIPALTVLASDDLTCSYPDCGVELDTTKLRIMAEALLKSS